MQLGLWLLSFFCPFFPLKSADHRVIRQLVFMSDVRLLQFKILNPNAWCCNSADVTAHEKCSTAHEKNYTFFFHNNAELFFISYLPVARKQTMSNLSLPNVVSQSFPTVSQNTFSLCCWPFLLFVALHFFDNVTIFMLFNSNTTVLYIAWGASYLSI